MLARKYIYYIYHTRIHACVYNNKPTLYENNEHDIEINVLSVYRNKKYIEARKKFAKSKTMRNE